jgi:phospholipid transport system substrate-binding protein
MTNSAMLDHRAEPNSGVGKRHHHGRPSQVEYRKMKGLELNLLRSMSWIAVAMALLLWAPTASLAESSSPAARHIEAYYDQLMPTLKAAGSLSVSERDRRFGPAITSAFDIGNMTRLASGPAWSSFSGAQQAAVREAFADFLVAEYANQVTDYSGESFVVDPQTSAESRGGGEIVRTKLLQPGGRTVQINYLVRGGRVIDVYLNGTVSDLATRRDEFASILGGGGGADALVKALRERTDALLGG